MPLFSILISQTVNNTRVVNKAYMGLFVMGVFGIMFSPPQFNS